MSEWNIFQLIAMGFNVFAGFCFFTAASRLNKTHRQLVEERFQEIANNAHWQLVEKRFESFKERLAKEEQANNNAPKPSDTSPKQTS